MPGGSRCFDWKVCVMVARMSVQEIVERTARNLEDALASSGAWVEAQELARRAEEEHAGVVRRVLREGVAESELRAVGVVLPDLERRGGSRSRRRGRVAGAGKVEEVSGGGSGE